MIKKVRERCIGRKINHHVRYFSNCSCSTECNWGLIGHTGPLGHFVSQRIFSPLTGFHETKNRPNAPLWLLWWENDSVVIFRHWGSLSFFHLERRLIRRDEARRLDWDPLKALFLPSIEKMTAVDWETHTTTVCVWGSNCINYIIWGQLSDVLV